MTDTGRAVGAVATTAADRLAALATAAASRVRAHVAAVVANNPGNPAGIPARQDVAALHQRVPEVFASRALAQAEAAFTAGWSLGRSPGQPATPPSDTPALTVLRADLVRIAQDLRTDLTQALARALADDPGLPAPGTATPGGSPFPVLVARHRAEVYRVLADKAGRRAAARSRAAAAWAVPAGHTAARLAHAQALRAADPTGPEPVKTWVATSDGPCPACRALHGVQLPLSGLFDASATADPGHAPPGAHGPLKGPPRHPWCRCHLRITRPGPTPDATPSEPVAPIVPTGTRDSMTAAEVRAMPPGVFRTLRAFLTALASGVARFGKRRR